MKKFLAILLSIVMLLSMGVVGASAMIVSANTPAVSDDVVLDGTTMYFNSTMNLSSNGISAPNVTYTYTLESAVECCYWEDADTGEGYFYYFDYYYDEATGETINRAGNSNLTYDYAYISEGVGSDITTSVTFTTSDYADSDHTIVKTAGIDFSSITFTDPGIYHYTLTETAENEVAGLYNQYYNVCDVFVTVKYSDVETLECSIDNVIMYSSMDYTYEENIQDAEPTISVTDGIDSLLLLADDAAGLAISEQMGVSSEKSAGFVHAYGMGTYEELIQDAESTIRGTDQASDMSSTSSYTITYLAETADEETTEEDTTEYYNEVLEAGLYGQDFIVSLTAFGDMASTTKDFTFVTVSANVAAGAVFEVVDGDGVSQYIIQGDDGVLYYAETYTQSGIDGGIGYSVSESVFTLDLSDGQEYAILSVVEEMEFKVTISDPSYDGYSFYYRDYADSDKDYIWFTDVAAEMGGTVEVTYVVGDMEVSELYDQTDSTNVQVPEVNYGNNVLLYWVDENGDELTYDEYGYFVIDLSSGEDITITAVFAMDEWTLGSTYTQTIDDVYANSEITYEMMDYTDDTGTASLSVYSTDNEGIDFAIVKGEDLDDTDDLDVGITYDEAIANTGVILDLAPFMVMVLAAGAYIAMRLVDKRKKQWA